MRKRTKLKTAAVIFAAMMALSGCGKDDDKN